MRFPLGGWLGSGYYSVLPFFGGLTLLLLLAATPLFRAADSPPTTAKRRVLSLDGLRGLLALAVVMHHLAVYHQFLATGEWLVPPSHFYATLGPFGVSFFFMITGYLFWGRLLRDAGRVNWRSLYTGRVFRIGPLFMVAALVLLLIVAVHAGGHRVVSRVDLAEQVGRWLSLGLFLGQDVNGWVHAEWLLAGVTWTVQWEWFFYLSLPVLAVVARRPRAQVPVLVGMLALTVLMRVRHPSHPVSYLVLPFCDLFLAGMLCVSAERSGRVPVLPDWASSTAVVVCWIVGLVQERPYGLAELFWFGVGFYLIASGCTVFGLLGTRAARRLGDISYGIYLLQGLAMDVVFRPKFLHGFDLSSPLHHWELGLLSCLLLLLMAVAAHVWIELPGVALGRRLEQRWNSRRAATAKQ